MSQTVGLLQEQGADSVSPQRGADLPAIQDLLALRAAVMNAIRALYIHEGFVEVDTPEITLGTGACESVPTVFGLDFLGRRIFLRQTAQLDLEVAIARWGLSRVFTVGRSFRAESRADGRHLCEFMLIEAESRDWDLPSLIDHQQRLVRAVVHAAAQHPALPSGRAGALALDAARMSVIAYDEAVKVLGKSWGEDLDAADEAELTAQFGITWVTRYPTAIKFFNMLDTRSNDGATVDSCDVLLPYAGETFGSAVREYEVERLRRKLYGSQMYAQLVAAGGHPDVFEPYFGLFEGQTVRRAGYGLGFDRLIQYVLGVPDVRAGIPFPVDASFGEAISNNSAWRSGDPAGLRSPSVHSKAR